MTFPKRGGFARDTRTGQYVRVTEEGMGGESWMVQTVYKSDGYWVDQKHLDPARDPHAWGGRELFKLLVVLAVTAWVGGSAGYAMRSAGMDWQGVIIYATAVGLFTGSCLLGATGLRRP